MKKAKAIGNGKFRIIGVSILALLLVGIGIYTYATQEVKIEVSQMPNVDIILTKSQTEANLTNFEADLKSEIVKQGVMSQAEIDSGKVNISAVNTQVVETQETFEWQRSVSGSVGSVSFTNSGKNVTMQGNPSNPGKNAIWIIPEGNQEQEFNFGYNIDFGDSFNAAGMLLRVQQNENGYLEGYMLSFNNSTWKGWTSNANGALWKFTYNQNNSTAFINGTDLTLIAPININQSGNLHVVANDSIIQIEGGGLAAGGYTYTIPQGKSYGSGYGFFSDHYSHGCSNIGSFALTNINLKTETVKKFTEVLQAPEWRDGSLRILVNVEDGQNEQFSNKEELAAIIAKLMNNDVYYIGWGTDANSSQIQDIISKNDGKGTFVANSSNEAVQATVDYIKGVIKGNKTNIIIANEPVNVKITSPITGVVDTPTDAYPNGVWKVVHNYNYYENPQGQYASDSIYTNNLIQNFENVGKYSIYCEDRLVTEVFAHRRPVSAFNMQLNGQEISFNSTSYDLDIEKNSSDYTNQKTNNGIKIEKWEIKKIDEANANWILIPNTQIGKTITSTLDANTQYMVRLTVTDYQGVETQTIKYVTTGESTQKPIASYKINSKIISLYDTLQVINESYDPSGVALTYEWKVDKIAESGAKTQVYTGSIPLTNYLSYGIGNYKMNLVASKTVNGKIVKSDEFSQTIKVTEDSTAPIITVTPPNAIVNNVDINININVNDNESGLTSVKYALTKSTNTPSEEEWTEETFTTEKTFTNTITIPRREAGRNYYLHILSENKAGIVTEERICGEYYIETPYEVIIQSVDKDNGSAVAGTKYDITGEYADGKTISLAKDVTTDKNGKITLNKVKLADVVKIRIDNTNAANGYNIAEYKNIKIDTSSLKIVIDATESSQDVQTQVSTSGESLQIKVPVEKMKFDFNIINKDADTKTLLSGTDFILKQDGNEVAKGTTKDGKLILNVPIGGLNTTKEYILEQSNLNSSYIAIGTTILKITFDTTGTVTNIAQKLFATNDAIQIPDNKKAEIVVNNKRVDNSQFSVNIHVKDSSTKKNVEGSKYKVVVQGENSLNYTTETMASDANGNIKINGLYGKGLLKLTFVHEEAATGYGKEKVDRYITIQRNEDGTITYNQASMANVFEKVENNIVYVNITNAKKVSGNTIKVRVLSKDNNAVGIEGIGIKVYKLLDNSLVGEGITNEDGFLEINNVTTDGKGEVLYKLVSENNDIIKNTPIFTITYNELKRITQVAEMLDNENTSIYYSEDDEESILKYTANVDIIGDPSVIAGDNKLIIMQENANNGAKVAGVQYKIRINGSTVSTLVATTDANGKLEVILPNDNTLKLQITQAKVPSGYQIDNVVRNITLTKDAVGKFVVSSVSGLENDQITVDIDGNVNVLEKINTNKNPSVIFKMAKGDGEDKISLGGVEFRITEVTTGFDQTLVTNSGGYVALGSKFIVQEGKSYTFIIQETKTIEPYELLSKPIKLDIRFNKEGEIIRYAGITYLQGTEFLSAKVANYEEQNNEVTVSLKVRNYADPNFTAGMLYDLNVKKIDKDGNEITGSIYDIEVRPYAQSSIYSKGCEITEGIEVENLAIKEDKTTILLKEISPALGSSLDSKIKVVTLKLDNDGNLIYIPDTTTDDIKVNITDNQVDGKTRKLVEVVISTDPPKEEEQPTNPENPDNPDNPDEQTTSYKVEYYFDGVIDETKTDKFDVAEGKVIEDYIDKKIVGFELEKEENLPLTVTKDGENIVKVYYVATKEQKPGQIEYTVNYYYDNELKDTSSYWADENDIIKSYISKETTGYIFERTEGIPLTVTEEGPNIINVYYIKGENPEEPGGPTEPEDPNNPENPDNPDNPEGPAEQRPKDATVALKVFNKSYGNWERNYIKQIYRWCPWHNTNHRCWYTTNYGNYEHFYNVTETYQLAGAQKLERMFKNSEDATGHGFNFITNSSINLETRIVSNGVVSKEIYETVEAKNNTEVNDTNGTDSIYLFKDYKNKTVEFTIKQTTPPVNYKLNNSEQKCIVKFDANGKIKSGEITLGVDTEDFAIGGISTAGTVKDIQYLNYKSFYGVDKYTIGEIEKYNSVGQDTLYVGLLNKAHTNPLQITVNLKDKDTNDGLNGAVSAIISEKVGEDDYKALETKNLNVVNGKAQILLDNTYANRTLRVMLIQTSSGTKGGNTYISNSTIHTQVEVKLDNKGNIESYEEVVTPTNAVKEEVVDNKIEYTIYNEISYNFGINLTKVDENGKPLEGVRFQSTSAVVTNNTTGESHTVFTYGGALTDKNGKVKLKIVLPETGSYKYNGKTLDIILDEYYVPDDYRAIQGLKIRVLFNEAGKVIDTAVLNGENTISITGKNNVLPGEMEKNSVDVTIKNEKIEDKLAIQITDSDSENNTIKLNGTKYKITSWDENEYATNSLATKEIRELTPTKEDGRTNIKFQKAHALRTIIYKIEEVEPAKSYKANENILIRIKYDKDGKIAVKPEFLTRQTIYVPNKGSMDTVLIEGNPVGSTLLKLNIINELNPKFTITINRRDVKEGALENKVLKAVSQVKNEDGSLGPIIEERISNKTYNGNTEIGFKNAHPGSTVVYTISEQVGDNYYEKGKIEVTFDEYEKIVSGEKSGRYITSASFPVGQDYAQLTISTEKFKMNIQVESTQKSSYSLAGYSFNVVNSKGETSNIETKTNSIGNIIEIVGDIYKGETITYQISQVDSAIDYEDTRSIQLTVVFDEDGNITSCTPTSQEGIFDLITTQKDQTTDSNMQIKMYVEPSERSTVGITLVDDRDSSKKIANYGYELEVKQSSTQKYVLFGEEGEGILDIGSYKNYKNRTILYTLTQTNVDDKYMINDSPIQVSVTYDQNGIITDARILASDGYVEIDTAKTIGQTKLMLNTKNRVKVNMQVHNINEQLESENLAGSQFKIIQVGKPNLYSDTKITDANGSATLRVGPWYHGQEITYNITNIKAASGFKAIPESQFTLTYDNNGKVINSEVSEQAQSYIAIEELNTEEADIKIIIKSRPLLTIGMQALDSVNSNQLVGGKYEVQQVEEARNTGNIHTLSNKFAHAVLGETIPGKTYTYNIVEKQAPLGYKYKSKDKVIAKLKVSYDADGYIIRNSIELETQFGEIIVLDTTDKPANFDIDMQIKYDEIEEFKVIVENESIIDNTIKISSEFNAQLTTGIFAKTVTEEDTGLGILEFGKVLVSNSGQILNISQSKIKGSYVSIAQIKIGIVFDENGKIKTITPQSTPGYATSGISYIVEQVGSYTMKITVKNNPLTTIKLTNVSDGSNAEKLNGRFRLTGTGINPAMEIQMEDGEATANLTSVPKQQRVDYTFTQLSIDKGYKLNKDAILRVQYDANGKITSAYMVYNQGTADSSTATVVKYDSYNIEIMMKNKPVFEIYLEAQDVFNENIKLSGLSVYMKELIYSKESITLTTNSNGMVNTILGSVIPNSYLDYEVKLLNTPAGYDSKDKVEGIVRVYFGENGEIINCTSTNTLIEVKYGSGLAVEMKVKYRPLLDLSIVRRNTSNNMALGGRELTISSSAMYKTEKVNTSSNGQAVINGGRIIQSNRVVYTISEKALETDTNMDPLPTTTVTVVYDSLGIVSDIIVSHSKFMTATGIGTRKVKVEIGSDKKISIAVRNSDYFNNTIKVSGNYEITSEKGDKVNVSASTGKEDRIFNLGKVYAGEKIKYTIHQINSQNGYEVIEDQVFTIQYNSNGTIGKIEPEDPTRLKIGGINQNGSKTQANIYLELKTKPTLGVRLKILDKQYKQGVYGVEFTVKNEENGLETKINGHTDNNGSLVIPVVSVYENKQVVYTITQTKTYGGYKMLEPIKVLVAYGNLGVIIEEQTKIINTNQAQLTNEYSKELYQASKLRGIQIEAEVQTDMGIGIEKTDVKGKPIKGVEYIITRRDVSNDKSDYWRLATNDVGEITNFIGELPKNKEIEYTISEIQAPPGYRKVEDTIIKVYYNEEGRISSYNIVQKSPNTTIEVATNSLSKMKGSNESIHLKLKIQNDDRITFKVVNQDTILKTPIQGAEFILSVETNDGVIKTQTITTNIDGEAILPNIEATGTVKLYFNQTKVPSYCNENSGNAGYLLLDKSSTEYKLTFKDCTDNLDYNINNETGIVTIYANNTNNLKMNILDVDNESYQAVLQGTHTIKAQYGDLTDDIANILSRTDNIVEYNGGNEYVNTTGTISAPLGSTYDFAQKKVVYTISTPTTPNKEEDKYLAIKDSLVVVEFDSKARVTKVNGASNRVLVATKGENDYTINTIIGFGNNDTYRIKVIKEANGINPVRINGAKFDIAMYVNGNNLENFTDQVTAKDEINGITIEEGVIILKKLKHEGRVKLVINETESPEGYEDSKQGQIEVEFDASLDKTDPEEILFKAQNINVNGVNAKVEVNEQTKEVSIIITNKPVLKLDINKIDDFGNSLIGMKFGVKVQSKNNMQDIRDYGILTIGEEGTIQTNIDRNYKDETVLITLTEEKNENYQEIAPITIEVYIDKNSNIKQDSVKLISGIESTKINEITTTSMKITVTNKLDELAKPYEISIVKTDENDRSIRLSNVLFQVKITPDTGTVVYKAVLTDEDGEINLKGLVGSGNIKIELKEIQPPEGYTTGPTEGYYNYIIKKVDGNLQKVSTNSKDELWNIDNDNKVIKIEIPNTNGAIGLAINKVDNLNGLNIVGTTLKLVNIESSEEYIVKTDNKGLAYFSLPKTGKATDEYTLQEIATEGGYELDSTIRNINITYDAQGNIIDVSEPNGLSLAEQNSKYVKYELQNRQVDIGIEPYNVQIINVDRDDHDILIPGAEFRVKISQSLGSKGLETIELTDDTGKIDINKVNGAGNIEITLDNIKAGTGYEINHNDNIIKLTRNVNTGEVKLIEIDNISAVYDESTTTLKIYVESVKEKNKYSVIFNMVDKNAGNLIQNANAKLKIGLNGEFIEAMTDSKGRIVLQGLTIPETTKYDITMLELQEPNGYKKIEEEQKITTNVARVYDTREIYNVQITQGNQLQIIGSSNNTINVNILCEKIDTSDDELYLLSDVYRVTDEYVERISSNTKVKDYIANMKSNGDLKIYDQKGELLDNEAYVGTGMKVIATKGEASISKVLSIIGDITGDGLIKALDVSKVKKQLIGTEKLEGAYFLAADVTDDGAVKALDVSKIKQAVVGTITL